jgi:hypothetical protein
MTKTNSLSRGKFVRSYFVFYWYLFVQAGKYSSILRLTIHKVGNPSPKGCLPIGNRNNQHCTNSLSAYADATATASGYLPYVFISGWEIPIRRFRFASPPVMHISPCGLRTKKHFCVLFSINKLTLKLHVNIKTITNSVYFVYSAVNK